MEAETGKSKVTKIIIVTGTVIIFIGLLCAMCSVIADSASKNLQNTPSSSEVEPTPTKTPKTYQKVYEIKGNGAKNSEFFTIIGDKFKVKYDCKITGQYGGVCQAYLLGENGEIKELLFNSTESEVSETVINESGTYQIKFNTIGANYSVEVEDYR